jgi:hypothetical protein
MSLLRWDNPPSVPSRSEFSGDAGSLFSTSPEGEKFGFWGEVEKTHAFCAWEMDIFYSLTFPNY